MGKGAIAQIWIRGSLVDDNGNPVGCEMWPANTTDIKTLTPIIDRIRNRFYIRRFRIVADRGMISADTLKELEDLHGNIPCIFGTRMRKVYEVKRDVLSRQGRYGGLILKVKSPRIQRHLRSKNFYLTALVTSSALIPNKSAKMLKIVKPLLNP